MGRQLVCRWADEAESAVMKRLQVRVAGGLILAMARIGLGSHEKWKGERAMDFWHLHVKLIVASQR